MITYRKIDDITKDREEREREEAKKKFIKDFNDIKIGVFPFKKKKKFSFLKFFFVSSLFLSIITFILGCIWLIKLFIISIF